MKARSITRRVVNIILIAELVAALALSVVVFFHEERTRSRALDVAMRGRADSLLGAIQDAEDPGDNVVVDPAELRLPPQDYWAVINADGRMVGHSAQAVDWSALRRPQDGISRRRVAGTSLRVLQYHALRIIDRSETDGVGIRRPVTLLYAVPEAHVVADSLASASFYILATVIVSLLTAALVAFFLRRSMRPVTELALAAEAITPPSLRFSPPVSVDSIQELQPLALALGSAVNKLRAAFAREQRFVGDAAHELKTATAVVRSSVQLLMLKERSTEQYQAGLERVLDDTERLQSLIAQMLDLASAEGSEQTQSCCTDLRQALAAVVYELEPLSRQHQVRLHVDANATADIALSPQDARTLLLNLLLNALQHSRQHEEVVIAVEKTADAAILTVEDRGSRHCGG